VIADVEEEFPNIDVTYTPISGNYPASMLAKFSARQPPDVFYVDSNVALDWIDQGVLEPLDSYIDPAERAPGYVSITDPVWRSNRCSLSAGRVSSTSSSTFTRCSTGSLATSSTAPA
jgi:ABC-type glycerol-3-phosphate transport system substrate-binding protein